MGKEYAIQSVCYSAATVMTLTQTEHVFQVIQIIITCIAAAISLGYTIWKWIKRAKNNEEVDIEELEKDLEKLNKQAENLQNKIKESKKCLSVKTESTEIYKNK